MNFSKKLGLILMGFLFISTASCNDKTKLEKFVDSYAGNMGFNGNVVVMRKRKPY